MKWGPLFRLSFYATSFVTIKHTLPVLSLPTVESVLSLLVWRHVILLMSIIAAACVVTRDWVNWAECRLKVKFDFLFGNCGLALDVACNIITMWRKWKVQSTSLSVPSELCCFEAIPFYFGCWSRSWFSCGWSFWWFCSVQRPWT